MHLARIRGNNSVALVWQRLTALDLHCQSLLKQNLDVKPLWNLVQRLVYSLLIAVHSNVWFVVQMFGSRNRTRTCNLQLIGLLHHQLCYPRIVIYGLVGIHEEVNPSLLVAVSGVEPELINYEPIVLPITLYRYYLPEESNLFNPRFTWTIPTGWDENSVRTDSNCLQNDEIGRASCRERVS